MKILEVNGDRARGIKLWWNPLDVEWSDMPEAPAYVYAILRVTGPINGDDVRQGTASEYWYSAEDMDGFERTDAMTSAWPTPPNGYIPDEITEQMTAEPGDSESYELDVNIEITLEDEQHNEIWSTVGHAGGVIVSVDNTEGK